MNDKAEKVYGEAFFELCIAFRLGAYALRLLVCLSDYLLLACLRSRGSLLHYLSSLRLCLRKPVKVFLLRLCRGRPPVCTRW